MQTSQHRGGRDGRVESRCNIRISGRLVPASHAGGGRGLYPDHRGAGPAGTIRAGGTRDRTGEGSVSVAPDYAQIRSGVTTRAKTVKEATDANSKLMAAVTAALLESGIAQKDIQTSRFSIQPVYAPQEPRTEPKLVGYSASNQVSVTIRQIGNSRRACRRR
jgi:hypothetical protein